MHEAWAVLPEYNFEYAVSTWGRVKRMVGKRGRGGRAGSLVKRRADGTVQLVYRDGDIWRIDCPQVDMLVAEAFLDPLDGGVLVHLDGDLRNCRLENLAYVAAEEADAA